jgi:uncharacterized membrane protein
VKGIFDLLNLLIILGMVGFALWAWPRLPDTIPTHFGIDGRADAWSERTLASWFFLPGLAIGMTLGLGWLRSMFPRRPKWVKLPDQRRLSDLPEVSRPPVLEMMSGFMALMQTELLVIFALIEWGSWRAAMGGSSQGIMILVLIIAIMASPFFMVVFFLRLQGAMKVAKKLEEAAAAAPGASA